MSELPALITGFIEKSLFVVLGSLLTVLLENMYEYKAFKCRNKQRLTSLLEILYSDLEHNNVPVDRELLRELKIISANSYSNGLISRSSFNKILEMATTLSDPAGFPMRSSIMGDIKEILEKELQREIHRVLLGC